MLQCVVMNLDGHLPLFGGSLVISNLLVNIKLEDARDTTSHFLNATYQEQVPSRTNVC